MKDMHKNELSQVLIAPGQVDSHTQELTTQYYPGIHNLEWKRELTGFKNLLVTKTNSIMIVIPFCFLSYYLEWNSVLTFALNFIGLIPLASLLGKSTEDLALHTGNTIGGLINATFGNIVEMIIAYQALEKGLLTVVQGSLLGSLLSNLLLVLGMAFLLGGLFHHIQKFNLQGATCGTSLLLLASFAVIIPTIAAQSDSTNNEKILLISRLSAIFIALIYFCFLFFQLYTHINLFQDDEQIEGLHETPECSFIPPLTTLLGSTVLVAFLSEYLTDTIEPIVHQYGISQDFIGVILLPIVGNAAEHMTAVTVAMKNKTDLTIGIAVGSSVQVALLVVPFAVICGWLLGQPMTLAFSPISATILMLANFVVIGILSDGQSNWLEGLMLMTAYIIVAIVLYIL